MKKSSLTLIALALLCAAASTAVIPAAAQAGRKARVKKHRGGPPPPPAVAVVSNPEPAYLSGEVSVRVQGNAGAIIRLGLAPNGVSLVEFPASDRIFAINPGNPDLVTLEDSPSKETDRFIVLRPGAGFLPAPPGAKTPPPATNIVVQMVSGMVLTLRVYPALSIEQNADRCVVTYDRDAVVAARRAAGLAVGLDGREVGAPVTPTVSSLRVAPSPPPQPAPPATPILSDSPAPTNAPTITPEPPPAQPRPALSAVAPADPAAPPGPAEKLREVKSVGRAEREDGSKENQRVRRSRPLHGLLITASTRVVDADRRQVTVIVRNTLQSPVRVVPGHPELCVQTTGDRGEALQSETLTRLKVESSSPDGMIAPGQAARYVITYEAPVLGAKQRLSVAVAQTNAADEPVAVELTAGTR
jgi:hypothetical protein